ncbi:hypothetical protein IP86_03025 [Rhodopseudomonas sp. AAP120]|uniref:hypothetical protein n=1 Tax=Rhodopseudomonas sp. AAP120 TaxID=1523430 RepID=UPI0006B926E8|nr:hypothetical protein [Rhodopseudomonas sp. AAP120]KPG01797.1 hypothetical protein IP86_03025 [Rhodopseudomonas sp. AAP120]
MTAALPLADTSLADALGNADPYKNQMSYLEADDELRRARPDLVEQIHKGEKTGRVNLLRSAGPISDAYILGTHPISCLCGPVGSGKTIASEKKGLVEAQRIYPGADGVRRYKLGNFRQKYDALWKSAIPSHWKLFPKDFPGSEWAGASPRAARHVLNFKDKYGLIQMTTDFLAHGEDADPEDLRGLEFTDVQLGEMDTLPKELLIGLGRAVGREPPREVTKRLGRIFGDMNAPDVLNWTYETFYEKCALPYHLYRQPGGMDEGAENLQAHGGDRAYYEQIIAANADNPWYVRRMVHAIPGVTRATDLVYPQYDDNVHLSKATLQPDPALPVVVGIDGGLTPSAVYGQEMRDGQWRTLREIALERGGPEELAAAMLALEARDFRGCDFHDVCDPAMVAGEDKDNDAATEQRVSKGSDRQRLAKALGRKVHLAASNETGRRWSAVRGKLSLHLGPARPGYLLDPSCTGLIRGKRQTYQFRKLRGSNELTSVMPTFDTHVADAEQYAMMECGSEAAKRRTTDMQRERDKRRERAREAPRRRVFGGR